MGSLEGWVLTCGAVRKRGLQAVLRAEQKVSREADQGRQTSERQVPRCRALGDPVWRSPEQLVTYASAKGRVREAGARCESHG